MNNCFPTGTWFNQNCNFPINTAQYPGFGAGQYPYGGFTNGFNNCFPSAFGQFGNTQGFCGTIPTSCYGTPAQFYNSSYGRPTFNWPVNVPQSQFGLNHFSQFSQPFGGFQNMLPYGCTTPSYGYPFATNFSNYNNQFGFSTIPSINGQTYPIQNTLPYFNPLLNTWQGGIGTPNASTITPWAQTTPWGFANCYGADCQQACNWTNGVYGAAPAITNCLPYGGIPQGFGGYGSPVGTTPVQGTQGFYGYPMNNPMQGIPVGQTPVGANCDNAYGIRQSAA